MRRRVVEVELPEPTKLLANKVVVESSALRDPRRDPRPGDVLERVMRPLRNPVRREVLSCRTNDDGLVFVRFRTRFGRPSELRLDAWQRWSGSARVVSDARTT